MKTPHITLSDVIIILGFAVMAFAFVFATMGGK